MTAVANPITDRHPMRSPLSHVRPRAARAASLRRALTAVIAGALVAAAPAAGAQTVTASYAPGCGPGTGCGSVRFDFVNATPALLELETLSLGISGVPYTFDPPAGITTYVASDAFGPFGGFGGVAGGTQLFIDFLSGGLPFTLDAGGSGFVEVALASTPVLTSGAFSFSATLAGGGTVRGAVAVVPEPATVLLVGGGLLAMGGLARRRRSAA